MRLSGACRTKQKLLQGLSSELQIRLLQRLWLGAEYPCEDQVVGVRGHQDVVAVRCQPHDSCPRSGSKTTASGLATLSFFDPFQAARHENFLVRLHWRKSKVMQNQLRKVAPNGEGRRGLHIIRIHSSQEPSPKVQTTGDPPKFRKANPEKGETGKERGGGPREPPHSGPVCGNGRPSSFRKHRASSFRASQPSRRI